MIVLDANILVRAVLGRRVRQLIETYAAQGVRFFAPDVAFADAEKYLPPLLKKRGKPHDLSGSLGYLRSIIEPVTPELYSAFEREARLRLRGRDEDDWPVLATALGLACGVWTEDADFFGTGIAVWTTNRVEIFLKEQAKAVESQEE
jgi:predicted nucleic acid-binding protein